MRFAPAALTLVVVTTLLAAYGSSHWSWIAGPLVAAAVGGLDLRADRPVEQPGSPGAEPRPPTRSPS